MNNTLESFSSVNQIGKYLVGTIDGIFTLILSIGYVALGSILLIDGLSHSKSVNGAFLLGLFLMPVLFIVIFLKHRIGATIQDIKPTIFCIISNAAIALAPLPIYFWR